MPGEGLTKKAGKVTRGGEGLRGALRGEHPAGSVTVQDGDEGTVLVPHDHLPLHVDPAEDVGQGR